MTAPAGAARVLAQAKLNVFLRVLAREQSGYHQLETLFCRLELADVVTVRLGGPTRTLTCAGPAMPPAGLGRPEDNLAFRAAEAYLRAAGDDAGFEIHIDKRIPVGGGLGGGSADAAAVLRALEELHPGPDGEHAPSISEIAAALGADVPFLTSGGPLALAWGRGHRMLALPALPPKHVALVVPPFGVATADAYGWLARSRADGPGAPRIIPAPSLASWDLLDHVAANDFEPVVDQRHPAIGDAKRALREHGARIALMSGSGSTVFGVFDGPPDVKALERATGCRVLLTRTAERVVPVERLG